MSPFKKLVAAAAVLMLAATPALAQKTMRLAHLNPESPFDSHSGAMAAAHPPALDRSTA